MQPIIRYELGDSVTLSADRCRCGSPLPVVTVVGRMNDLLRFIGPDGAGVDIPPLALGSVVEETVGVRRFQALQTGPATLTLRLETEAGADPTVCGPTPAADSATYLARQGLRNVALVRDPRAPQPEPHSGKLRQVMRTFDN